MAGINLKLIVPAKGRVALGPAANLGPKTKLAPAPHSLLDKVPRIDARARAATARSIVLAQLDRPHATPPAQPLGAIGGSDAKAAPGSFLPSSAATKVVL